jgi:hypothetical protein
MKLTFITEFLSVLLSIAVLAGCNEQPEDDESFERDRESHSDSRFTFNL